MVPQRLAKKWGLNPALAERTVPVCFACNRLLSDKPVVTFGQRLALVRRNLWKRKLWNA